MPAALVLQQVTAANFVLAAAQADCIEDGHVQVVRIHGPICFINIHRVEKALLDVQV